MPEIWQGMIEQVWFCIQRRRIYLATLFPCGCQLPTCLSTLRCRAGSFWSLFYKTMFTDVAAHQRKNWARVPAPLPVSDSRSPQARLFSLHAPLKGFWSERGAMACQDKSCTCITTWWKLYYQTQLHTLCTRGFHSIHTLISTYFNFYTPCSMLKHSGFHTLLTLHTLHTPHRIHHTRHSALHTLHPTLHTPFSKSDRICSPRFDNSRVGNNGELSWGYRRNRKDLDEHIRLRALDDQAQTIILPSSLVIMDRNSHGDLAICTTCITPYGWYSMQYSTFRE